MPMVNMPYDLGRARGVTVHDIAPLSDYNLYILIKYKGDPAPEKPSMAGEDRVPDTTTKAIFGGLST